MSFTRKMFNDLKDRVNGKELNPVPVDRTTFFRLPVAIPGTDNELGNRQAGVIRILTKKEAK